MTQPQPPDDSSARERATLPDTSQLIQSVNTALMQGEVYRRGIWATHGQEPSEDSMIEVGKEAFALLLADSAKRDRDFEALRIAYALQAEEVERLRAFVEKVRDNYMVGNFMTESDMKEVRQEAEAALSKLAGDEEAGKP